VVFLYVFLSLNAESLFKTRHDYAVFCRMPLYCKNPLTVLEFAMSRCLYDDACALTRRGHPTARRMERR